jgi:hypothetical protein
MLITSAKIVTSMRSWTTQIHNWKFPNQWFSVCTHSRIIHTRDSIQFLCNYTRLATATAYRNVTRFHTDSSIVYDCVPSNVICYREQNKWQVLIKRWRNRPCDTAGFMCYTYEVKLSFLLHVIMIYKAAQSLPKHPLPRSRKARPKNMVCVL